MEPARSILSFQQKSRNAGCQGKDVHLGKFEVVYSLTNLFLNIIVYNYATNMEALLLRERS